MKESAPASPHERVEQKGRTREAILAGARALLARGEKVTVTAAAAEARVSKATAYRYYPDPGTLAAETTLSLNLLPYEAVVAGCGDLRARLLAINLHYFDLACANAAGFRQFLARVLEARPPGDTGRGGRRVAMYQRALDDDDELPRALHAPLIRALALATGAEAMIVLLDVTRATEAEARETIATVTGLVIDHYLAQR